MLEMVRPSPPGSGGPGAADRLLQDRISHAGTEKERRARARAGIAAVDGLLETLEQCLLDRQDARVATLPHWQRGLEASGLVVPVAVTSTTTTTVLHKRLLDWQEELLNAAYPRRATAVCSEHGSHGIVGEVVPFPTGQAAPISTDHRACRRMAVVMEEERERIARDIHDDTLQTLGAMALRLDLLCEEIPDPGQRGAIEQLLALARDSSDRLRSIVF
jgi:signal transduction histidine kinase